MAKYTKVDDINKSQIAFLLEKNFTEILNENNIPDLVLLDINMPEMDGYQTAKWIRTNYKDVKVLALSVNDNESAIIRMLKCGAKGYILKDSEPEELKLAIDNVVRKGFYYSDLVSNKLIYAINKTRHEDEEISFTEKEISFLKYACTEYTYKEIAEIMSVSPRTVDGYRDILFNKLQVKTRVGLVMYAISYNIINLSKI